jgi:hypothetical protein
MPGLMPRLTGRKLKSGQQVIIILINHRHSVETVDLRKRERESRLEKEREFRTSGA